MGCFVASELVLYVLDPVQISLSSCVSMARHLRLGVESCNVTAGTAPLNRELLGRGVWNNLLYLVLHNLALDVCV